uniref:Uncharacterized protein n=1 Tax=Onchocerca volvulus TaxID=6282 RepID=A0A8R1TP85_ONCVO
MLIERHIECYYRETDEKPNLYYFLSVQTMISTAPVLRMQSISNHSNLLRKNTRTKPNQIKQ